MSLNKKSQTIEEYTEILSNRCKKKMVFTKKLSKIDEEQPELKNVTTKNFMNITKYNYSVNDLRTIAKNNKLKLSGNKSELITRIFNFLYLSSHVQKIQSLFRGYMQRQFNNLFGPAFQKRNLCTNNSDFITMEEFDTLDTYQFFSYKDLDGFIYGFDIASIYNLIFNKTKNELMNGRNPYNRQKISVDVLMNIKRILKLGRVLKKRIRLEIEDENPIVSAEKGIELRALSLFQNIDALGNYSDPQWFLSLNRHELIKFCRELNDIWNYRAQLTNDIKRNICFPNGDPFRNVSTIILHTESDMSIVRKMILEVMEKFVNSGIDKDSKSLGAYYVLGGLTLVNESAAAALPWLYQSLCPY